jgi:hypothetical protein
VFQPLDPGVAPEVRDPRGIADPKESHFFLAVCASRPQAGGPLFVYLPSAANVLRERERHIRKLEEELSAKERWLDEARRQLAESVEMCRAATAEIEQKNLWSARLNSELEAAGTRIVALQDELQSEQAAALKSAEGYEAEIARLNAGYREAVDSARVQRDALVAELAAKCEELASCVEILHDTERTVEERTAWARGLEQTIEDRERRLSLVRASRWMRLGRKIGLGPDLRE